MRTFLLCALSALLLACAAASGEWTEATSATVLEALTRAGAPPPAGAETDPVAEAADTLKNELLAVDLKMADWQKICRTFFEAHPFTPNHGALWVRLIDAAGEGHERAAQLSGVFAAEGVAAALGAFPPEFPSLRESLQWLDYIASGLEEKGRVPVSDALRAALTKSPPDLVGMMRVGPVAGPEGLAPGNPPEVIAAAMQICLTLMQYARPSDLNAWLRLPADMRIFYEGTGILLFDNGALGPLQLESLESLFRAVPRELHQVAAIIVPEGMQIDATAAMLNAPGVILNIFAIPMDLFSDPTEFSRRAGPQAAPEFTLSAAAQLMRAIQFAQFSRRPELPFFRDQILGAAGLRPERYLRPYVAPETYLNNPDELLPLTAVLWFLNSQKALAMASDLLVLNQRPPMETLMLLADVLSGGGPTTLIFNTDEMGRVSGREVSIQRVLTAAGPPAVVGVGLEPLLEPGPWNPGAPVPISEPEQAPETDPVEPPAGGMVP
jgi:hypothetical protein